MQGDSRKRVLGRRANQALWVITPVVVTRGFTFYEGGLSPPFFFVSAVPFFDVRSSLNLAPSRGWCGRSEASHGLERHTCKYLVCMGMQT